LEIGLFENHRIVSVINRVKYVSDRISYIVPNINAPSDEKRDDSKDRFY
jgi:hypothetical protein